MLHESRNVILVVAPANFVRNFAFPAMNLFTFTWKRFVICFSDFGI